MHVFDGKTFGRVVEARGENVLWGPIFECLRTEVMTYAEKSGRMRLLQKG